MIDKEKALSRAKDIIDNARKRGFHLRLIGGAAVAILAPRGSSIFYRQYKDLDLVGYSKDRRGIEDLAQEMGLEPNKRFNALYGHMRLMLYDPVLNAPIDVLLDKFEMCHAIDLRGRLELLPYTIPPSDLLLTKLQICKMTPNDILDVKALLTDLNLGDRDSETTIDVGRIVSILSDDWGFYTTVTDNLKALIEHGEGAIREKLESLLKAIEESPKSLKWKARAKIGRKMKWYKEPEEVENYQGSAGGGT